VRVSIIKLLRAIIYSLLFSGLVTLFTLTQLCATPPLELSLQEQLQAALELHHNTRGDAWVNATDPNERSMKVT
jgi:hypothetical protein